MSSGKLLGHGHTKSDSSTQMLAEGGANQNLVEIDDGTKNSSDINDQNQLLTSYLAQQANDDLESGREIIDSGTRAEYTAQSKTLTKYLNQAQDSDD